VRDAIRDDARFARTRAGENQNGPFDRLDGELLLRVQDIQIQHARGVYRALQVEGKRGRSVTPFRDDLAQKNFSGTFFVTGTLTCVGILVELGASQFPSKSVAGIGWCRPFAFSPRTSKNEEFDPAAFFAHSVRMANSFGHLFRITTWGES